MPIREDQDFYQALENFFGSLSREQMRELVKSVRETPYEKKPSPISKRVRLKESYNRQVSCNSKLNEREM